MKNTRIIAALLAVFVLSACQEEEKKVLVRVQNNSGYDFINLTLQSPEKKVFYGDLPKGEVSYYQFFTIVSEVPKLDFAIDGKRIKPKPEMIGKRAQSLPTGNFSYKVYIEKTKEGSFYQVQVENDIQQDQHTQRDFEYFLGD